jgi:hypothetical protein
MTFGTGNPNPKMWLYGVMRIKDRVSAAVIVLQL